MMMSTPAVPRPGKIILLNGATSSGKSTIAKVLQERIDQPFWHISIDHLRDAGVLPIARIRSGEFKWETLRNAFFDGFHHALPAYAAAGNNLIVEHIIENKQWLDLLVKLLAPFDVYFVGIHCPLDELERRERDRGDRPIGDAHKDYATVHLHTHYDLELDSTIAPEANVNLLLSHWKQRVGQSAFTAMKNTGSAS